MHSAMVTFNGRITLPTGVRKQLGLKTGDNIEFVEKANGRFELTVIPATNSMDTISGVAEGTSALAFEHAGR